MHIHYFARIVALPFAIAFAVVLYFSSQTFASESLSYWLLPLAFILTIIYVFHNQLDQWWHKKFPIPLDQQDKDLISQFSPFYRGLSSDEQILFQDRVHIFIKSKDFTAVGKDQNTVPYDVQLLTAMIALEISFYNDNPNYENYDRVVFYKHPFPTPGIQQLHTVETHHEDGVILIALDYMSAAIKAPDRYYHVGFHAFFEAFVQEHPNLDYPSDLTWEMLEEISGFKADAMQKTLGLPTFDLLHIAGYMFFVFGDQMKALYPTTYNQFAKVFNKPI